MNILFWARINSNYKAQLNEFSWIKKDIIIKTGDFFIIQGQIHLDKVKDLIELEFFDALSF